MIAYQKPIIYGIWMILFWIMYFNINYFSVHNKYNQQLEESELMCNFSLKDWQFTHNPQAVPSYGAVGYGTDHNNTNKTTRSALLKGDSYTNLNSSSIYKIKPSNLMTLPKLRFLPNLKNPCFYVHDPPRDDQGVWVDNRTVLKCWPSFQLIGVEKCGTSDLYERLHLHHHLLTMINSNNSKVVKEPLWYNGFIRPVPHNHTLGGYLGLMDNATRHMYQHCKDKISSEEDNLKRGSPCPYMVSDFSARTMNHNYFWYKDEPNQQYYFPKYLTADKVHHVYPQTKIIVMLRDPTERIFSDYKFYRGAVFKHKVTSEDFNSRVLLAIQTWNQCTFTMRIDPEKCAEGYNWTLVNTTKIATYWAYRSPDRIRVGLYSLYLKRWLQLFPRENIHVIQLEEYSKSPLDYIEKHVLPFLGLEPYRPETRKKIEATNSRKSNMNIGINLTMWDSTRQSLNEFYAPYNFQLSEMLHDRKFLWNG